MICVPLLGRDPARRDRPIRTGRRDKPIIQLPSIALRVAVIVGIAAVMFGIVFFRLWFLQILSGEEFVAKANDNRLKPVKIVAQRGNIVDRHGEVIVENRGGQLVGIRLMDVPKGTLDAELDELAPYLKMKPGALRRRIKELPGAEHHGAQGRQGRRRRQPGGGRVGHARRRQRRHHRRHDLGSLSGLLKVGSLVDLAGFAPEAYNGLIPSRP